MRAPRAPCNPLRVEGAEQAAKVPAVEPDPADQPRHDCDRGAIRSHDERGIWTEIHRQGPARASARIIIMVRTRLRMISLRMAARCSVKNNSVNATSMTISGTRMAG